MYYKAPSGQLAYNFPGTAGLIVGVRSRLAPDLSRLEQGLPQACFRANNLPIGLAIDASTGVIEGTPTAAVSCQVTIVAFNCNGEISVTVPFKIVAERAPSSLAYDEQSASRLIVGMEMKLAPKTSFVTGVPAAKFKASSLPEGVELNEMTGVITAKLKTPVRSCLFKVFASNASGECEAVVTVCAAAQATISQKSSIRGFIQEIY